jgi:hypothetical protein
MIPDLITRLAVICQRHLHDLMNTTVIAECGSYGRRFVAAFDRWIPRLRQRDMFPGTIHSVPSYKALSLRHSGRYLSIDVAAAAIVGREQTVRLWQLSTHSGH